jgi:site-specific recombinase XerD
MGTWGRAWELHEIMAWLGHADIKTTLRYSHLSPENLHGKVRQLLNAKEAK